MDSVRNGWFVERNDLWPGQRTSLEVEEVLYSGRSEYQDIMVLKTKSHGRVLVLDGIIQCSEQDEFSYQEMISFLPLCAHSNPKKVLIVGGGDGGVAREISKHPLVEEIIQVEIDEKVIDVSKKYLPFMSAGFSSPKLTLKICDGFEYMRTHRGEFDVIVTDSSDPIGPAVNLFTESYFELLRKALRADGIVGSQAGTVWVGIDHAKATIEHCKKHFDVVKYALTSVPTYPTGQIGFLVGCLDKDNVLEDPKKVFSENELNEMNLRYYNSEVHKSAFVLPNFVRR
ncbi:SpdS, partial [Trypoxylus dichotomus]